MSKKKDSKLDKDVINLNKLSQLMLNQNESLRKLLEELSRKEKVIKEKNSDVDQTSV